MGGAVYDGVVRLLFSTVLVLTSVAGLKNLSDGKFDQSNLIYSVCGEGCIRSTLAITHLPDSTLQLSLLISLAGLPPLYSGPLVRRWIDRMLGFQEVRVNIAQIEAEGVMTRYAAEKN